jgi:DNA-binding response OmpR family regulator
VGHILVVDDDPDIRLLLRLELSAEGHHISEAGDGRQALAAIAADPPDLVLLDIMMPEVDGWEVLRQLDHEACPPVVVITALASADDRHTGELLELGAIDVVAKPFDPDWLARLCQAVLLVDRPEQAEYRRQRLERSRRGPAS